MTRGGREKESVSRDSLHVFSIWNSYLDFRFDAGVAKGMTAQGGWGARELLARTE